MSKKTQAKDQKGFTLVELLVVIAIIGILATIGIVSYNGTQRIARDNQRKSDLQAIATAYKMHYQDKRSWKFTGAELVNAPSLNHAATTTEGQNGSGEGYFNYSGINIPSNGTNYYGGYFVSMANALVSTGYLSGVLHDPLQTNGQGGITSQGADYMKLNCIYADGTQHGIVLMAQLENRAAMASPFSIDPDSTLSQCLWDGNASKPQIITQFGTGSLQSMNYAIRVQ